MSKTISLPQQFLNLLSLLVHYPSVTGAETAFFRAVQRELEECEVTVKWYEGVLVAQGSQPKSAMFSAHIDRHGLVCTGPNEFQYAAFVADNRSDLLGNSASEVLMERIADRYNNVGVYAYQRDSGAYLSRGVIESAYICEFRNNLIFNIAGLEHLHAGIPVAFDDSLHVDAEHLVAQIDNVLSVAALIYLFKCGFQGTGFFTAQEEAGKSWRFLLEWFRRFGASTNQLIVLDTSPYADQAEAEQQDVVLRYKDVNSEFNHQLTDKLKTICEQNNIRYQFKDQFIEQFNKGLPEEDKRSLGSTELGRIVSASSGLVDGTTLQVPTSGYHTLQETAATDSVNKFLQMLSILAGVEKQHGDSTLLLNNIA